ncbi:MAG: hypothetical protein ETSY1_20790 [Candidatus Entotheonella factor]|uniref:histidine kinase n=1 Tax=Entotheonella factor TaxID=1429438 RepID=W4LJR6_ENTF1|nr:MAG: hypothetical protein ETSY1_20790 [Candidatus Entotheonella factor]
MCPDTSTIIGDDVDPYVMMDALRLRQILLNLVNNAVKFTNEGAITIRVELIEPDTEASTFRFSVTDTGIGIPEAKQSSIFNSFVQAEEGTTRKFGGTGLGTTIARQLVTLMGGYIGLESQPGQGSTFWFTLRMATSAPPTESGDQQETRPSTGHLSTQKGRLLLAEDYPINQRVIRKHLEDAGYLVTIVNNGEEAVHACMNSRYDLILMDVQMPVMDGHEATRKIRSDCPLCADTPILALTANADRETQNACKQATMNDILTKPIRRNTLLAGVDQWIHGSGVARPDPGTSREVIAEPVSSEDILPIDYDVALQEFGDMDLVVELVGELIWKLDMQIRDMYDALTREDLDGLRRIAHTIKSGAGTLEAVPLYKAATQLEHLCKAKEMTALPHALGHIAAEHDRLKAFVYIQTASFHGKRLLSDPTAT